MWHDRAANKMLQWGLCYIRVLVALRILPFETMPAVLHQGSCYVKAMLYKDYTTVINGWKSKVVE